MRARAGLTEVGKEDHLGRRFAGTDVHLHLDEEKRFAGGCLALNVPLGASSSSG